MDDVGGLRRTIRRCTAVLIVALGVAVWAIGDLGTARFGVLLALGGLGYMGWSFVFAPVLAAEAADGESATDH